MAIVTGAARRIGATIVEQLHGRGLDVLVHYRGSREQAEALATELNGERPGSVATVSADLADAAAPAIIVRAALDAFGRIDLLVNNASAFYPTDVDEATPEQWDELMASNLRAPYFLSRAARPHLARRGGAIVNLVDIHALVPLADHSIYCQAKAGLVMQTRALAKDLAPEIRVNAVAPGAILWPENEGSAQAAEAILEKIPLGHQGRPEDIAGAVCFLALDAPYVTGQILSVDGGRTLNM
ncbi:pteridine reductase [Wenzhouxiangella marina]|uniref:Pteridine reductase n=1 Tax=Wenzhouxiangella marina TaxID=1579979 RepID=A0A0K0XZ35_9GAMM|nr:pteridine reductase [Wenzhouxiangella marina]